MASIKEVDAKIGSKNLEGSHGMPNKSISMNVPGEGTITKPYQSDMRSTRSAANAADDQKFSPKAVSAHQYDSSKNFSSSGGGNGG